MGDTQSIHQIIERARLRLRLQGALETGTRASILAIAVALVVLYLSRRDMVGGAGAAIGFAGALLILVVGAVMGASRKWPTHVVAARIDRACGLSDRLGTACDFETRLESGEDADEETRALMVAAIRDAVAAVPRANPVAATPWTAPADGRVALGFAACGLFIAALAFPPGGGDPAALSVLPARDDQALLEPPTVELEEEDLAYSRDLVDELRRTAEETGDPELKKFVDNVDELLDKAEKGEISKEELLEKLAKNEQNYFEGMDADLEESVSDLKNTGKVLKQEPLTRELGKALEKGDLEGAQQEFDKLAQKLENDELNEQQADKVGKSLKKAAEAFEKAEQKKDQRAQKRVDKQRDDVRRLKKKLDKEKNPEKREQMSRLLKKKERELKRLEREQQQQQQSAQKRRLKQLHRNLEKAAENLDRRKKENRGSQARRRAAQRMREAGEETGKVSGRVTQQRNQRKVASQVTDLREALRRAKQRGKNGPKNQMGKNGKNKDFGNRARGKQGSRTAWRPGQSRLGRGQGQKGPQWGDQDGGDPLGASERMKNAKVKDEQLTGVQGRGPSRREVILSAAQRGFANTDYKEVYADYKDIIEEVMRGEKVPSGYKYYIKRYFQKIRPQQ